MIERVRPSREAIHSFDGDVGRNRIILIGMRAFSDGSFCSLQSGFHQNVVSKRQQASREVSPSDPVRSCIQGIKFAVANDEVVQVERHIKGCSRRRSRHSNFGAP